MTSRSSSGRCARSRHLAEDHPQVLIIALGDAVAVAAMVDRLVHHAEIINLKGESYRLKDRRKEVTGD
jgi:hypothetical protein